ncbi:blue copper protein-like [Panicum miliaceum]|uniref:Blue copper protein-like n=1 Tax=Panicum miliaceum TaxID=4540 RepID=A0A3L6RJ89_PANMI|nr:blue copper protein-like [Panicum miliaceum]
MASRSALIALLVAVSCAAAASAVTFTVGDTQGWNLGVDYDTWARGKNFSVGDTLVFNFPTGTHDVLVVSKSDYDGCNTGSAMNTIQTSPATVTLTSADNQYYICGISTHCSSGGMKLAVNVGSGSGGSPSPSTPSAPGTPSPTTPAGPSPSAAPARRAAGPALAVAAGVLLKLALF